MPDCDRLAGGRSETDKVLLPSGWKARGSLPDGPLDLVGDIHGEISALGSLMGHLGYQPDGSHAEGRRLVFVGDLIDRGPDSPGVVRRVADLVERGRSLTIMGNHDLNAVAHREKKENTWLFGHGPVSEAVKAVTTERERDEIIAFLRQQPLALERDDLRVVHACWDDGAIRCLDGEGDPAEAYHDHEARIEKMLAGETDSVTRKLALQNQNPMKLITSGPEVRAAVPFVANGEDRNESRHPWWNDYGDGPFVVFGHYWRNPVPGVVWDDGLFPGQSIHSALGAGNAICIDYSVGGRWYERTQGRGDGSFLGKLAALRWPERTLVFDDGECVPMVMPVCTKSGAAE